MKLKLTSENEPDHEHLALLFNLAVAAELKQSLRRSGLEKSEAWPMVESAVFDLAMLFDEGTFKVGGKVYKPRVAFMAEDGSLLDGAAEFGHLHEYATVFEDDLEATEDFSITT